VQKHCADALRMIGGGPASRRPSPAVRTALLVLGFVALAGLAQAAGPRVITQRDSGKEFTLHRGSEAKLRLSGRWTWTTPKVTGSGVVRLVHVDYFVDPGYSEWEIRVRRAGVATITARGVPTCEPCALTPKSFRVTIRGT
jgi:hypothetical protein